MSLFKEERTYFSTAPAFGEPPHPYRIYDIGSDVVTQTEHSLRDSDHPASPQKTVFLDRDGVINHDSPDYIKAPEEWQALPGSLEAIAQLCRADYRVVVATNQAGVARGVFNLETLNRIHRKMVKSIREKGGRLESIFFCPHGPDDACSCRKPKPGPFLEISQRLGEIGRASCRERV